MDSPSSHTSEVLEAASPYDRASSLDTAMRILLEPICKSIDQLESRLSAAPQKQAATGESGNHQLVASDLAENLQALLQGDLEKIELRLKRIESELTHVRRDVIAVKSAPPPAAAPKARQDSASPTAAAEWERIICGPALSHMAALAPLRKKLLAEVLAGSNEARAFAGQLMLVQAANVDDLPEQLKYVGEAYYRWNPHTSNDEDPLETALAEWLTQLANAAGLRNSIELVRVGERFDGTRHTSNGRGLNITAVHGWIVLRDDSKVYTKASVSVN